MEFDNLLEHGVYLSCRHECACGDVLMLGLLCFGWATLGWVCTTRCLHVGRRLVSTPVGLLKLYRRENGKRRLGNGRSDGLSPRGMFRFAHCLTHGCVALLGLHCLITCASGTSVGTSVGTTL